MIPPSGRRALAQMKADAEATVRAMEHTRDRIGYQGDDPGFVQAARDVLLLADIAEAAQEAIELVDRLINAALEQWHTVVNDEAHLPTWLGLTNEEYAAWAEGGAKKLLAGLEAE